MTVAEVLLFPGMRRVRKQVERATGIEPVF